MTRTAFFDWLDVLVGFCLFVCLGFSGFEGGIFLFVLEASHLKKSHLCFLAAWFKKPKPYQKAARRILSVGDHKSTVLKKGLNYLLQLHFQLLSSSFPEGAGIAPDIAPGGVPAWPCDQLFERI